MRQRRQILVRSVVGKGMLDSVTLDFPDSRLIFSGVIFIATITGATVLRASLQDGRHLW